MLDEQVGAPLFPTPLSEKIATFIIGNLDENGYYEGDTEAFCDKEGIDAAQFWKVHARFAHVEPVGIAARDLREAFFRITSYNVCYTKLLRSGIMAIIGDKDNHKDITRYRKFMIL